MAETFDIGALLKEAFGVNEAIAGGGFTGMQIVDDVAEVHRLSYLGTPIIYPVIFKGQKYRYYQDNGELDTIQLADFELPAVTLSSFSRKKNVSKTELTGGYGTVKEMYGFGDWQITIQGVCLRDPSHPTAKTAMEQHNQILAFEKVAEAIPVTGELYNEKGIDALVIESIKIGQLAGKPGVIPFTLNCIQDTPKELLV